MKGLIRVPGRGDAQNISPWGAGSHTRMDRAGARDGVDLLSVRAVRSVGRQTSEVAAMGLAAVSSQVDGQALTSRSHCAGTGVGRLTGVGIPGPARELQRAFLALSEPRFPCPPSSQVLVGIREAQADGVRNQGDANTCHWRGWASLGPLCSGQGFPLVKH